MVNPTQEQLAQSSMNITVAGSEEAIMMVEGGANEAPEEEVLDAIMFGHETIKELCRFQKKIIEEVGKPKRTLVFPEVPKEIDDAVAAFATEDLKKAIFDADKLRRDGNIDAVKKAAKEHFADIYPENGADVAESLDHLTKQIVRDSISMKASVRMAESSRKSAPLPAKWDCSPGFTAVLFSPAARPRLFP